MIPFVLLAKYYCEEVEEEKESLTPKQVGIICVGGAAVLALVAIVTIKLINKKKSKNRRS